MAVPLGRIPDLGLLLIASLRNFPAKGVEREKNHYHAMMIFVFSVRDFPPARHVYYHHHLSTFIHSLSLLSASHTHSLSFKSLHNKMTNAVNGNGPKAELAPGQ